MVLDGQVGERFPEALSLEVGWVTTPSMCFWMKDRKRLCYVFSFVCFFVFLLNDRFSPSKKPQFLRQQGPFHLIPPVFAAQGLERWHQISTEGSIHEVDGVPLERYFQRILTDLLRQWLRP